MAYTTIDDPSAYFQTALYTGNGSTGQNITNDGNSDLQPDWVWAKRRDANTSHGLVDSSRGVRKVLSSNGTSAEVAESAGNTLTAFLSDGFTVGDDGNYTAFNASGSSIVAWQWKCNGGTTTSNTNGTNITSTVQANTTAGFSIVTWTGTGTISDTVGHGLGVTPDVVIAKERSDTDWWHMRHESLGSTENLFLNETNAARNATGGDYGGNIDGLTSSVFGFSTNSGGDAVAVNDDTETNVAYCFAEVQGYSKFGSYTGNGNADGPFVYTGFKPAWIMVKLSSGSGEDWHMFDSSRSTSNVVKERLIANDSDAENANDSILDFVSNGFKLRESNAGWNGDGNTYIYMAFAEHPFVSSEGVPTTAG